MCPHSCLLETVYLAYFLSVCVPAAPPHCHQSPFLPKTETCISFFSFYLLELTYCVSNVWLSACQDNILIIMQRRINKMLTLKFSALHTNWYIKVMCNFYNTRNLKISWIERITNNWRIISNAFALLWQGHCNASGAILLHKLVFLRILKVYRII